MNSSVYSCSTHRCHCLAPVADDSVVLPESQAEHADHGENDSTDNLSELAEYDLLCDVDGVAELPSQLEQASTDCSDTNRSACAGDIHSEQPAIVATDATVEPSADATAANASEPLNEPIVEDIEMACDATHGGCIAAERVDAERVECAVSIQQSSGEDALK